MAPQHWWFPVDATVDGRRLTGKVLKEEGKNGAHIALVASGTAHGVKPGDCVWFCSPRPRDQVIAVGVVQANYRPTDGRHHRVVVALHPGRTALLMTDPLGFDRRSAYGRSRPFQDVGRDDAKRLTDWWSQTERL